MWINGSQSNSFILKSIHLSIGAIDLFLIYLGSLAEFLIQRQLPCVYQKLFPRIGPCTVEPAHAQGVDYYQADTPAAPSEPLVILVKSK